MHIYTTCKLLCIDLFQASLMLLHDVKHAVYIKLSLMLFYCLFYNLFVLKITCEA